MFTLAKRGMFLLPFLLALGVLVVSSGPSSDGIRVMVAPLPTPVSQKAPYAGYKDVTIGMSSADVRTKLGKPQDESDAEDNFTISEFESARVFYDENKTVRVISIMYTGDLKLAPTPKAVIGTDIEAKPDGGMHKTVQYPKAGFWISYVRTGGDDAIVIVTIQKMAKEN